MAFRPSEVKVLSARAIARFARSLEACSLALDSAPNAVALPASSWSATPWMISSCRASRSAIVREYMAIVGWAGSWVPTAVLRTLSSSSMRLRIWASSVLPRSPKPSSALLPMMRSMRSLAFLATWSTARYCSCSLALPVLPRPWATNRADRSRSASRLCARSLSSATSSALVRTRSYSAAVLIDVVTRRPPRMIAAAVGMTMSAISRVRTRQFLSASLLPFVSGPRPSRSGAWPPSGGTPWASNAGGDAAPDSRSLGIDAVLTGLRCLSSDRLLGGDRVTQMMCK
ncbi:hypothetical protein Aros01_09452 [Streptosporangium roseum]